MHNLKLLILGLIFSTVSCIAWANRINQSEIVTIDLPLPEQVVTVTPAPENPFVVHEVSQKDLDCLSLNIYNEADKRSRFDMIAVGRVVMIRTEDSRRRWPRSPCAVVYQKRQFTWTLSSRLRQTPPSDDPSYVKARAVAIEILRGEHVGAASGANHYYASNICKKPPTWTQRMVLVATIGYHKYYRG